jgi:hypothetical protein
MTHESPSVGEPGAGLGKSGRALVIGRIGVSVRCGYLRREAGRREPCRQPIVVVFIGERVVYCYPPDWDAIAGMTAREVLEAYGRAAV